jgi:hypothetical protein
MDDRCYPGGALYGPLVMFLLVTGIEVYTKYLLHSDLETLDREETRWTE